jgi:hypothetical protein
MKNNDPILKIPSISNFRGTTYFGLEVEVVIT